MKLDHYLDSFRMVLGHLRHRAAQEVLVELISHLRARRARAVRDDRAHGDTGGSFRVAGGGVGIGRSLHVGQVGAADGTALAGQKIARVLSNDPGLGVFRHIDSGDAPSGPDTLAAYPSGGVRLPS